MDDEDWVDDNEDVANTGSNDGESSDIAMQDASSAVTADERRGGGSEDRHNLLTVRRVNPDDIKNVHPLYQPEHQLEDPVEEMDDVESPFGRYKISHVPSLGIISGHNIAQKMDTHSFADALSSFLLTESPSAGQRSLALLSSEYPVYKEFSRMLPSLCGISNNIFCDCVRVVPAIGQRPVRYNTVVFVNNFSVAQMTGVKGYHVGQVLLESGLGLV
ncbi:hypothetical protein EVJ58_g10254 [Rhodofomes roseus]|uniref:Uncharacterized protein n=1 Tax=Rhodofomes roseus TaxID=34475 RepID=A0A4Y9XRJ0_9APHY|nr:hypothetical protein EVJ58_g10254 [Rhodofomes roseus]